MGLHRGGGLRHGTEQAPEAGLRRPVDRNQEYELAEAIEAGEANAKAKFDETVEISMNLGIDPRHADQMVRGLISCRTAPARRCASACSPAAPRPRRPAAGADVVGAEDLAEKVQAGEIDFDRCIATPDMMALVGRLGKILGPRGLMPNPKLGTVTMDVAARSRPPRAARSSSAPRRPASSMPASARRASPTTSWWRTPRRSSTRSEGQADGRQGHLHAEGLAQLDHGAGRAVWIVEPRRRVTAGLS
jgi:hypothetical protein